MTPGEYFDDHLPHRVNLLTTFRERYSTSPRRPGFVCGEPRDLFRCAKDTSILMVRFFCTEMGLYLPKRGEGTKGGTDLEGVRKFRPLVQRLNPGVVIHQFTEVEASADSRYPALLAVMKAANRAVAHVEDLDVNHPIKVESDHWMLLDSITWVEALIDAKIYAPNHRSLAKSMALPNNVM